MNLKKALADYEEWEVSGEIHRYYKPRNVNKGLCAYCDNKLYKKGKNLINCEYHWLKRKYRSFYDKCRLAKDKSIIPSAYPAYKKIKCKFEWKEFLAWCIENTNYKKMKEPHLIRIDKKGHFEFGNIEWFDALGSNKVRSKITTVRAKRS